MTQAKGIRARLLLDYEDAYGSDNNTPAAFVLPVNSIGLSATQTRNTPGTLRGHRNPDTPWAGRKNVSGSIVVPVDYTAMWYWLKAMFGDPSTTGATDPYTHEWTVGHSQPSMVLEKQFQDINKYWKYNGVKIASMNLRLGGDEELVMTLNLVGATETPGTDAYDGSPTSVSISRLHQYQVALQEGGGSIASVTSLDLTVNFGLDEGQYVIGGGGVRASLPEGMVAVTGTVTALFEDHSLVDKSVEATESSLQITITDDSDTYSLDLMVNELQYGRAGASVDGPQGVLQQLPFTAYYDDHADESVIVATLVNADEHAST